MKLAVAMSGGVDSSVVAKILKDEGHDCVGLFLKLWSDPTCSIQPIGSDPSTPLRMTNSQNRCCDYEALEDARMVAAKLDIPFYVIDAKVEFKKEVVDYFLEEYKNLRTPNPCIVCNETIKFDLLLKKAISIGCEKLTTGHYARIMQKSKCKNQNDNSKCKNEFHLLKGIDETKDQSYMLYRLNHDQLSQVLFPVGEMKKKDVRELAVKWDLPVKEKPESQEICFFADKDYRVFLKRYLDPKYFQSGDIVDANGKVIGKHDGLLNYTIGQRRLIDQLISNGDKEPLYVIGFNKEKNQLIVGKDDEIYKKEMIVGNLRWISGCHPKLDSGSLSVKIRYRHPDFPCEISPLSFRAKPRNLKKDPRRVTSQTSAVGRDDKIKVLFKKPQRAVTPGQSAVFYVGDEVVGGGVIES
ncbi:MAG: tRNA 2-thiouridine(34) synthase MnmA [Candidatus Berkelbacteria bacterium]|nr:tRNA 2-thiouridine(34) synthase MnmA [Candidatus Berkelbacteria bacterium]